MILWFFLVRFILLLLTSSSQNKVPQPKVKASLTTSFMQVGSVTLSRLCSQSYSHRWSSQGHITGAHADKQQGAVAGRLDGPLQSLCNITDPAQKPVKRYGQPMGAFVLESPNSNASCFLFMLWSQPHDLRCPTCILPTTGLTSLLLCCHGPQPVF